MDAPSELTCPAGTEPGITLGPVSATDELARVVTSGLPGDWHGTFAAVTTSTQDLARAAARQGAPRRSVYVADEQTAGRGRRGRSWLARPGTALMVSLLFRTTTDDPLPFRFTMLVSVALVGAIESFATSSALASSVRIKWPNDVLINGRKVAGVLAEAITNGHDAAVVVGCGVNVNEEAAWLAGVAPNASSLAAELVCGVDRGALLLRLLDGVDHWAAQPPEALREAWQALLWAEGQSVLVRGLDGADDAEVRAVVLGAEPDGALRLRLSDGRELCTLTAEIIL